MRKLKNDDGDSFLQGKTREIMKYASLTQTSYV